MKRKLKLLMSAWVVILFTLSGVLAGCGGGGNGGNGGNEGKSGASKSGEPIKLGVLMPLSGPAAEGGKRMKDGFELAKEEINAAGGINGRPIELVYTDDEANTEKGVSGAKRMIEENKVVALLGTLRTGVAMGVAEVAANNKLPFLVTVSSGPEVTELVGKDYNRYKYLFRNGGHASHFVLNTAPFVTDILKAKTYYYVGQDVAWSKALGGGFKKYLESKGVTEVGSSIVEVGANEFSSVLMDIKNKKPDVVISSNVSAEGVPFAKQYYDAKIPAPMISTAGVLTMEDVIKNMGEKGNYVNFMSWSWRTQATPKTEPFYDKFKQKYGYLPSGFEDVRSYDGLQIMAEAIGKAGSTEAEALIQALEKNQFVGAAGNYAFDEKHQAKVGEGLLQGVIGQWKDGKATLLWPKNVANGELQRAEWWVKK